MSRRYISCLRISCAGLIGNAIPKDLGVNYDELISWKCPHGVYEDIVLSKLLERHF